MTRAIAGGIPVRVLDTTFYLERETFARDHTELLGPVIDPRRKRMYVAGFTSNRVYGLDLPLRDCGPPGVALGHLWPGDGTLTDHAGVTQMSTDGEAAFEPGLVGRAFKVDRTVLQAETQYTGLDAFAGLDGSIEMWVKMTDVTGGTIVEFLESKKSLWKLAADPDLHLRFTQGNSPAVRSASPIHLNLWQNLALVARGPHLMIYVNGQASIETTRLKEGLEGVRSLRLGPFSGLIDEVAMYDRPLSAGEIKGLIRSIPDCTGVAHTVK